jgi:hypothetical protein
MIYVIKDVPGSFYLKLITCSLLSCRNNGKMLALWASEPNIYYFSSLTYI